MRRWEGLWGRVLDWGGGEGLWGRVIAGGIAVCDGVGEKESRERERTRVGKA